MKKIGILTFVAALLLSVSACSSGDEESKKDALERIKEEGKIVVATSPDFAPNEFYILDENGNKKIVGSDISLAEEIAKDLGVELEIKATNFDGVLLNTQTGDVDLCITGIAKTKKREEVFQFSDVYYKSKVDGSYQGLVVHKDNAKKFKSVDDIKKAKLTIGAQKASIQYELAQTLTDESKIKQYDTTDMLMLAVDAKDVDAITVSSTNAIKLLETFPDLMILDEENFDLDKDDFYSGNVIAFPKGEEYKSLIAEINKTIKKVNDSGQMKTWVDEAEALMNKEVTE